MLYIGLYIIFFNCEVRSCIISACWIERTIKQSCIPWPPNAARFHWSPPYEIMQLQTSIRSCEGNHYVVTVIDDSAENSAFLSNNPGAQGLPGVWAKSPRKQMTSKMALQFWTLHLFTPDFSLVVHQLPHNIILCSNMLVTLVKQNCTLYRNIRHRILTISSIYWPCQFDIYQPCCNIHLLGYVLFVFRLAWLWLPKCASTCLLSSKQTREKDKAKKVTQAIYFTYEL